MTVAEAVAAAGPVQHLLGAEEYAEACLTHRDLTAEERAHIARHETELEAEGRA